MPNIEVLISATDDLTPKIQAATNMLRGLEAEAAKVENSFRQVGASMTGVKVRETREGGGEAGGIMEKMAEQGKELMAGIGYNIGLWNVGMMASQAVLNALGDAFKEFNAEIQLATQWENRLDQSNIQSTQSFDRLREAALLSGTALTDTAKRVQEFTSLGMGGAQAITTTQAIQQRVKETGVDVGDVVKKAQTLSATAQDVMKAGEAGGPFAFLKPQAEALARMESARPYEELQMQRRQLAGEREFQDTVRVIERASTERHRAIEYEMEDRFRAINREMELRHLAINQEMADRHRVAEQSAADQDRLLSRQTGIASGIKGVMQAALGMAPPEDMASRMGAGVTQAVSAVRAQMEIGMKQLQKDLGIAPDTAKVLIQAGAMSPGVLLQEAQAAREEQRITEQRQRQNEEIQTGRNLQREAMQERKAQEDEQRDTQRGLAAEELAMQYAIQDAELELQRRNQNDRIDFEEKFTVLRYRLNKAVLDAQARDEEQRRIKEAVLHGKPQAPGLERGLLGQPGTGANLPFPLNLLFGGTRRENLGPELIGKEPGPEQDLNDTIRELDKGMRDSVSETQGNTESIKQNTESANQNNQAVKILSTALTNAGQIMDKLTQAISGRGGQKEVFAKRLPGETDEGLRQRLGLPPGTPVVSHSEEEFERLRSGGGGGLPSRYPTGPSGSSDRAKELAERSLPPSSSETQVQAMQRLMAGGGAFPSGGALLPPEAEPWKHTMGRAPEGMGFLQQHETPFSPPAGTDIRNYRWGATENIRWGTDPGSQQAKRLAEMADKIMGRKPMPPYNPELGIYGGGLSAGVPAPGPKPDEFGHALSKHFEQTAKTEAPASEATLASVAQLLRQVLSAT